MFGVSAAPSGPKTISKGRGEAPHLLDWFLGAGGAAQTPKLDDLRPAQKPCIKSPSVLLCLFVVKRGCMDMRLAHPPDAVDLRPALGRAHDGCVGYR
jgi:hypothetical protein